MNKLSFLCIFGIFAFCVGSVGAVGTSLETNLNTYPSNHYLTSFREWFESFRNHELYVAKTEESVFENWISNEKLIQNVNSQNLTYTLGHNLFSGIDFEEFSKYNGFDSSSKLIATKRYLRTTNDLALNANDYLSLPTSVDWRQKGAVSPVKDQGQCGSCWSFSTTGSLEGAYAIKYGDLVSFSEQQLVDCDKGLTLNHGCNGGLMDSAFDWIGKNGGLCTETDYPYFSGTTLKEGTCQKSCQLVSGSAVSSHVDVKANSDTAMMSALALGPVSIAIEADQREFQLYKSGVFTGSCGTNLDHGVLLVGYGSDSASKSDYYIMKNSWGTSWGESGYMRMGRGSQYNNGAGQCGLLMQGSYPVV
jgi:C1A family cysteine protease